MKLKVLVVEDDDHLREVLLQAATLEGYSASAVSSAEEALNHLQEEHLDILVTDVNLPAMTGLDLLQQGLNLQPAIIAIVMTAYGTIDVAVEAMKRGASDFLVKPFELATLLGAIRVAANRVVQDREAGAEENRSAGIVAESLAMRKLFEQVAAIAPFNTTVLIRGETGTGKEMVARSIRQQSTRKSKALVALNCAAVPEQLLEDELFGHVKGAFTGAQNSRQGRFEQANEGTLFLDEIGDMSLPLQAKLLRVLQEREFEKLGSTDSIKVDVRIVAATSADLERRISEGSFRADLFYRLNVVQLRLPTLRERMDDIEPLAKHFLKRFCESFGLPPKTICDEVLTVLKSYRWPGNVRQLQNAMERAAALSGVAPIIMLKDLPEEVRTGAASGVSRVSMAENLTAPERAIPEEGLNFDAVVTEVERELLLQSLSKSGGNKMRAAKLLNLKRTTFVEKLKRLQIDSETSD